MDWHHSSFFFFFAKQKNTKNSFLCYSISYSVHLNERHRNTEKRIVKMAKSINDFQIQKNNLLRLPRLTLFRFSNE